MTMTPAVKNTLLLTACLLVATATGAAESMPNPASTIDPSIDPSAVSNTKTLVWPDGTRYVGAVSDGKRSGKGTIFWQDGTRFVGTFKDDLRNGPGTMILPDGTVYTGYFTDDLLVDNPATATNDVAINSASGNARPTPARPTEMAAPVAEVSDQQLLAAQSAAKTTPTGLAEEIPPQVKEKENQEKVPAPDITPTMTPRVENATPLYQPITRLNDAVQQALQSSIDNWAMHWSQQDALAYLNSYSPEFKTPGSLTRSQWQAQRKTRLASPTFISVSIDYDNFSIVGADEAKVTFKQTYTSDRYNDVTQKYLRLKKQDDRWLISAEGNQ
ncbi:MAG: hypothetical protein ACI8PP_002873 [Candidatus Pseudothioglobus sp.]|jgi:hypothetical protein